MSVMIDFDKGTEKPNRFMGAEKKTTVTYEGNDYMLKYPDPLRGIKFTGLLSYKNNQFSEYIGCQIFKSCGFNTQDVYLGYFTDFRGIKKTVVGCKDFTQDGSYLYEASKLANQTIKPV